MAPPWQVIGDSDDDDDYEDPVDLLPVLPDDAPCERPAESGSTDPSFFRTVYEEQHRDNLRRPVADEQPVPDMWEVPSSPQRPPSRLGTKRKCVDDSTPDASNEATSLAGAQRFQIVIDLGGQGQDGAGGEMGIATAGAYPPSTALTESTIAYPTPSRFASSGPRYAGSSNDDMAGQVPDQAPVRLPDLQPTPPRRREVLLSSSPDEIAEPTPFGQTSLYGDVSEPPPRSAAREKRRGSDIDELAPDLDRQCARQKEADFICIDSTDDEESMPIIPAIQETTEPAIPPKKKRGRKPKAKKETTEPADGSGAPDTQPANNKRKRPRGRQKQQPVSMEVTSPLEKPAEAEDKPPDTTLCEASGNAGRADDEPRRLDKEAAQDSCPPSRPDDQPALPPDPRPSSTIEAAAAAVPAKKPISAISGSQGRVPFRVGLSKKYRIAPLLKTVPKQ